MSQFIPDNSEATLNYYCTNHAGMGGDGVLTILTANQNTDDRPVLRRTSDVNSMFVKDDTTHNVGDIRPGDYAYILQGAHGMNKNHSFVFSNEHMGLTSNIWSGDFTIDHTNANAIVITAFSGAETIHVDNETIELSSSDRHLQVPALIGVTAGTVEVSKALVVDANKDIGTLRNITATNFAGNLDGIVGGTTPAAITGTTITANTSVKIDHLTLTSAGTTDYSFDLPANTGTDNQVLQTDGSGTLSWATTSLNDLSDVIFDGATTVANFTNSLLIGHSTTGTLNAATENTGVGKGVFNALTSGVRNVGVGNDVFNALTEGYNNTSVGYGSLKYLTTGQENCAFGTRSLQNLTTGSHNVVIGEDAGRLIETGTYNVIIGKAAGYSTATDITNNIGIGKYALNNCESNYNIAIGSDAHFNLTTGDMGDNIAIGHNAQNSLTTGSGTANQPNISIGNRSLYDCTTGSENTAIGHFSLNNLTDGTNNIAIGNYSGNLTTTGDKNICIGINAVCGANQQNSILIGTSTDSSQAPSALDDNTVVLGNTDTLKWLPADDNGVDLGSSDYSFKDGYFQGTIKIGSYLTLNEASGASSAYSFVFPSADGSQNQVLQTDGSGVLSWVAQSSSGATSLNGLTDASIVGTTNIFIGNIPGSISGGACTDNTALGKTSLSNITTGDRNTAVGHESLEDITEGGGNTAIGYGALHAAGTASDGSFNTAIGNQSGNAINGSTGKMNTLLGNYSGLNITTGNSNICIGHYAQPSAATNVNEIVIGSGANTALSGYGSNTVMIGNTDTTKRLPADDNGVDLGSSDYSFKDGFFQRSIYFGYLRPMGSTYDIAFPSTIGSSNQVLQISSIANATISLSWAANSLDGLDDVKFGGSNFSNSLLIGNTTTGILSSASDNTGIGVEVFNNLTSGNENVGIGRQSLNHLTEGDKNVGIGNNSLYNCTTGEYNIGIGYYAGSRISTSQYNICIGYRSGFNIFTSNNNNICIGHNANCDSTHSNSIIIGHGDGTSGGIVPAAADSNTVLLGNTDTVKWLPADDNGVDLGSSSYRFKDGYFGSDVTTGKTKITGTNGEIFFDTGFDTFTQTTHGTNITSPTSYITLSGNPPKTLRVGMGVTGPGVAANSFITAITQVPESVPVGTQFTVNNLITSNITAGTTITFSAILTQTTQTADISSGGSTITLSADTSLPLQIGMGVTGTNIPDNSLITSITTADTVFVINNTIATDITGGTRLTFSYAVDTTLDRVLVWDATDNYVKFAQLANVCFLKGTKITLSDRTYKNIEDLTLADDVLTYKINGLDNIRNKEEIIKWKKDKLIGEFSDSGIRNIWINPTQTYLIINDKLNVTPGHVMFFRRENKYYFSHAVNLRINDELMKSDGNYEIIDTIKLIEEEINVYNFEVDNDSTYFAEDYLVHHMCELCSGYSNIL